MDITLLTFIYKCTVDIQRCTCIIYDKEYDALGHLWLHTADMAFLQMNLMKYDALGHS